MLNLTMDINEGMFVSLTSTSQNLNAASKSDIVIVSTQYQVLPPLPRIPGLGVGHILHVAPDFDAPLDLPHGGA
ncbi:MAG: hypothetical protein ACRD1O_09400 [Terriglobia bacterium]